MSIFTGKKVLCFIALPHHNRFLVPIMEALQHEGMEAVYFTVPAEGAFEITLNQAKLPYRHMLDYATGETKERSDAAYRELRGVLQEKILANRTLQSVPLVIEDKVMRSAVESFYCLERMVEIEKPDLLFALHELNPWGKILGYLSHVYGVPYFTLQEGLYYGDLYYYRFHTDYSTACIVWGEECREILMRAGCGSDKIFPLGNTHIWEAKRHFTDPETVAATRAALGIGNGKKMLLFLMSHSHYRPFDAQPFLRWMKERGDAAAVFKWHPVTQKEIIERALEKMRGDPSIISVNDFDTYALIGASDVCITVGNSTTGLEALAFGKPLMEVRLPDQAYSFVEQGVAERVGGFEDMGAKIEAIFTHGLAGERAANIEKYLARNFTHRDERTCARIVDLVGEALGAKREQVRSAIAPAGEARFPCSIVLPVDDSPLESLLATLEGIAAQTAAELFEVLIVNCASRPASRELVSSLGGDVKVIEGEPGWSYAQACNRAAAEAQGRCFVFLKPGIVPTAGWLEALLQAAEETDAGIVGGQVLNKNGLLWHVGCAFDVNQSPFSVYRMLPPEFSGASKEREFKAVELPFLVSRELFCRLGGFNAALHNRFEDVDFCLRVKQAGRPILYTPKSRLVRHGSSWEPPAEVDETNRIRFYSRWSGSLWQDDREYLEQDGLTHDALSALYRELAARVAHGAQLAL